MTVDILSIYYSVYRHILSRGSMQSIVNDSTVCRMCPYSPLCASEMSVLSCHAEMSI